MRWGFCAITDDEAAEQRCLVRSSLERAEDERILERIARQLLAHQ
jgi:hypothetical protein